MQDDPFQPEPYLPKDGVPVARPRPGARGRTPLSAHVGAGAEPFVDDPLPEVRSVNPLMVAAHPILMLLNQIRGSVSHPDPSALREELSTAIRQFESAAASMAVAREDILAARYVLCTALDEAAGTTPWGGRGVWGAETLLVRFHDESWGGEKVFALIDRLSQSPERNMNLLEMSYTVLSLGLSGKYSVMPDGKAKLTQLRERLYGLIIAGREPVPGKISINTMPATVVQRRWLGSAPFWAAGALVLSCALGTHIALNFALAQRSDQVFSTVLSMRLADRPELPAPRKNAPAVISRQRLRPLLISDVDKGSLRVTDQASQSTVVVHGEGFFRAGSANISTKGKVLLARVANALATMPGPILISGHTDSQPIRTARFPSNWHLSKSRAVAVVNELSKVLPANRMKSEGRASSSPVADNKTAKGRAQNRRVEIRLFALRGRQ